MQKTLEKQKASFVSPSVNKRTAKKAEILYVYVVISFQFVLFVFLLGFVFFCFNFFQVFCIINNEYELKVNINIIIENCEFCTGLYI